MVSNIDTAKRALVTLLKSLATIYLVAVGVTRESSDGDLRSAFRQVSRRARPDRGGSEAHQKSLQGGCPQERHRLEAVM